MHVAVIPVLDEERTIGTIVLKAQRSVDQVIVVDDGSRDDTAEVAREAGAEVIVHDTNQGKGRALSTGIEAAVKAGADRVVLLDGDGQHDPAHIPALLAAIDQEDADLVVGSRTLSGEGRSSGARKVGRNVLDRVTNLAGGLGLRDTQSGFRAARADALALILPKEAGMGVESEMLLAAAREGLTIVEVAIPDDYPDGVEPSVAPARHGASVVASVLRFVREEHPLLVFGGGGLVMLAVGLFLGYQTATGYYDTGEFWPGKAMLSMLFLILASVALLGAMILDAIRLRLRGPRRHG